MAGRTEVVLTCALCAGLCLLGAQAGRAGTPRFTTEPGEELLWRLPIEQKLEKDISFSFEGTPLDDVVDFLRTRLQINFVLDQAAIAEDERLVTFTANNMRAADALKWIMTLTRLDNAYRAGAIYISTRAKARAARTQYLKIYDTRDLTKSRARSGGGGGDDDDDDDDDDGDSDNGGGSRRGGRWLLRLIVELTGRENWRHVGSAGDEDDEDETTNGAGDF